MKYMNKILGIVVAMLMIATSASGYIDLTGTKNGSGSGGSVSWNDITDVPADFADNVDNTGSGGNIFNQDLNTTNNVTFNTLTGNGSGLTINWSNIFNVPSSVLENNSFNATLTNVQDGQHISYNSSSAQWENKFKENTQLHNTSTIDTLVANVWVNVTWDMVVIDETTPGFSLHSDSQNIIAHFGGIVRVQGCLHPIYEGPITQVANMYTRVLVNGTEARCLQTAWSKDFRSNTMDTLHYVGTIRVENGSQIQVQYQVDSTNIDFEGAYVFDNPVSASVNLERID